MATRRFRIHTNPMSFPTPIARETWTKHFEDSGAGIDRPLYVDLGTGKGDFLHI